jgi:recombinational DNA repair protein (RecF pathway)
MAETNAELSRELQRTGGLFFVFLAALIALHLTFDTKEIAVKAFSIALLGSLGGLMIGRSSK